MGGGGFSMSPLGAPTNLDRYLVELTGKSSPLVCFAPTASADDPQYINKFLLAYASDFNLLTTSMQPHGVSVFQKFMQVASLDHALWFHANLRMDDWLLYAMDSPWAGNARGFSRASIFNRAGQLVASVAQEGLTRLREDWK